MREINEEQKKTFDAYLWSLLFYGEEYNGWEAKLEIKIRYLLKSKLQLASSPRYNYDVAIINALQELENGMIRSWTNTEWRKIEMPNDTSSNYYETVLDPEGKKIRCVTTYADRMGMTAMSTITTKLIDAFRPKYLFMTGISACVSSEKADIGDIIVAQSVIDGASGKFSVDDNEHVFVPDYQSIETNPEFIAIINRLKEDEDLLRMIKKTVRPNVKASNTELKIHTGPMASVPAVVADKTVIDDIKGQERKLLGVEMEAYGMYYAASHSVLPHPEFCAVIKSATDFANEHKGDEFQRYRLRLCEADMKLDVVLPQQSN
jgi:nucleoside phosphorylase